MHEQKLNQIKSNMSVKDNKVYAASLCAKKPPKACPLSRKKLKHRQPMAKAAYKVSKRFYVVCQDTGLIDKIRDLNYEVIPLKKRENQLSLFSMLQTIEELVHIYRQIRPEIIHHSSLYVSFLGSIASLFLKGPKIFLVIMLMYILQLCMH